MTKGTKTMKTIGAEFYCRCCGTEKRVADINTVQYYPVCEKCKSEDIYISKFITCDCGSTVYLGRFTCECENCGRLYNSFGQELAPPDEWDEDDRYACYGPQNYYDD